MRAKVAWMTTFVQIRSTIVSIHRTHSLPQIGKIIQIVKEGERMAVMMITSCPVQMQRATRHNLKISPPTSNERGYLTVKINKMSAQEQDCKN